MEGHPLPFTFVLNHQFKEPVSSIASSVSNYFFFLFPCSHTLATLLGLSSIVFLDIHAPNNSSRSVIRTFLIRMLDNLHF